MKNKHFVPKEYIYDKQHLHRRLEVVWCSLLKFHHKCVVYVSILFVKSNPSAQKITLLCTHDMHLIHCNNTTFYSIIFTSRIWPSINTCTYHWSKIQPLEVMTMENRGISVIVGTQASICH